MPLTHVSRRIVPSLALFALCSTATAAQVSEKDTARSTAESHRGTPDVAPLWPTLSFRRIGGGGNNLANPSWGAANTPLLRRGPGDYRDSFQAPAGAHRASARAISNAVVAQSGSIPNTEDVTDFVWQWGQFLDHDIDLTGGADPAEPFPIEVPPGDPFFDPFQTGTAVIELERSLYVDPLISPLRQQINQISSFIDASNVYGSDMARATELRTPRGFLKTSAGHLLPFNVNGFPNAPADNIPTMFLAGDVRANEQVGLTAMHTLFVREHNRIALILAALGLPIDLRYEVARALVGAEMQVITYNEFLPVLLGPDALPPYAGYEQSVNPGISNVFSTAAYRFGHSMLSPVLLRLNKFGQPISAGNLPLKDAFFAPQQIIDHGIEPVLRGLARQRPQQIDPFLVDDVRNFLFGPPGAGGFDLASLNIQRGRDHGLPSYNQTRIDKGLAPALTWADISSDPAIQAKLASVYARTDDVDVWVGGLAEDHVPGALVGELVHTVLKHEFMRLRNCDRFWYQNALPPFLQGWVETRTLARIIRDNTTIGAHEIQSNVFVGPTYGAE